MTAASKHTDSTAATSSTTTRRSRFFDGKNALTTGPNPGNRDRSHTATFGDTYTFSPTMVNSFHATFNRRADNRGSASNLFSPSDLGMNMFENLPNYIQLTISNYFNVACGTCAPRLLQHQHLPGFGRLHLDPRQAPVRRSASTAARTSSTPPTTSSRTGSSLSTAAPAGDGSADLMIGRMSTFVDGNALSDYMRQTVFAAYAQDNFKVELSA